ncbi:hypothetical protein Tco_1039536 [Tanacetum coccineum]
MSPSMEARITEHAAAPTPPLPVASPPLPLPSPLTTSPSDAGAPLGYSAVGIRMRAAAVSPPLLLPSTSHRTDIPEAEMSPRKRACFATPAPELEIGESLAAEGVDQRVTKLDTTVRQRTEEFQVRFEEAYDDRAYLRDRVNTLFRDRPYHRHKVMALDREAIYARIAWTRSEERSAAIEAHTQLTAVLRHIETLEARDPEPRDGPAEAGSSSALTWWNSHVRVVGQDVAYAMPWMALKRMITDKYCPRGEIKNLESEMFPEESAKVERYVGSLPDMIHNSVKASKPQSMQEAIEFATEMMDKKMHTVAEHQAENKRKFEDTSRNNQN